MSIGSVTKSFLSMNSTKVRSPKEDIAVVSVMLLNLAMELDNGNMDIVTLFKDFGRQLVDLGIGPTG